MRRLLLLALMGVWFCLLVPGAPAQESLQVIELHHRTAAELIPVIRPLLDEHDAISGTGFKLLVRASPEHIARLEQLVKQLDRAPRRLRITVRRASVQTMQSYQAQARGEVGDDRVRVITTGPDGPAGVTVEHGGPSGKVRTRIYGTQSDSRNGNVFQLQVLEGHPAFINAGLSFPVPTRTMEWVHGHPAVGNTLTYKQVRSGFFVRARVRGEQVFLQISPQREALSPRGGGMVDSEGLTTTVSGPLGQWIDLGGTSQNRDRESAGTVYQTEDTDHGGAHLWVRVQVLQ